MLWQVLIETQEWEKYRIVSGGERIGGSDLYGNTAGDKTKRRSGCEARLWIVGSLISHQEQTFVKTIIQGSGSSVTRTRDVSKDFELGKIISLTTTPEPQIHPLNTPFVIGRMDGRDIRLMVGSEIDAWDGEHCCSEPGVSVAVAIMASRAPGR